MKQYSMFLRCRLIFNSKCVGVVGSVVMDLLFQTKQLQNLSQLNHIVYKHIHVHAYIHIYMKIWIYMVLLLFAYTQEPQGVSCVWDGRVTPWLDHGNASICPSNSLTLLRDRLFCSQPRWRDLVLLMKLGYVPCLLMFLFTCLSRVSILNSELVRSAPLN